MTRFKAAKEVSALRADISKLCADYVDLIEEKAHEFTLSKTILTNARAQLLAGRFDEADDYIAENENLILGIESINFNIARTIDTISAISGIENREKSLSKALSFDKTMSAYCKKVLSAIESDAHECSLLLEEISQLFEKALRDEKRKINSRDKVEHVKSIMILPGQK